MTGTQVKTGTAKPGMTNYSAGTVPEKNKKEGIKNAAHSAVHKKGGEADMSTTDYLRQKMCIRDRYPIQQLNIKMQRR